MEQGGRTEIFGGKVKKKLFFFEKKNQKTLALLSRTRRQRTPFSCCFF